MLNPLDNGAGTLVDILAVRVYKVAKDGTVTLLEDIVNNGAGANTVNKHTAGITVSFVDQGGGIWSAEVSGLKANYRIEFDTAADHNAVLTRNEGGKYDIGGFSYFQGSDSPDIQFDFSVRATDYDGDVWGNLGSHLYDDFAIIVDGTGKYDDGMFNLFP